MSRVLYREYRPLSLDDVKGQDHIISALKNSLKNNSIAHAYLFTGSHGVGKTSVARILAHLINDLDYTGEDEHLDIIEIDAASNRRIDEIRDLREKAFVAPTSAKYKVYIIDEVHMLTREAFNALLKTLEEPPDHAIFILATTEAHKVPSTIISRTQRFSFRPQDDQALQERLSHIAKKEKINVDNDALALIARHSNRSFRDAISLLDQIRHVPKNDGAHITQEDVSLVLGVPSDDLLTSLVDSLLLNDSLLLFKTTEELRQKGVSASVVSQELLRLLRKNISTSNQHSQKIVGTMKSLLETINSSTYDTVEIALLSHMDSTDSQNIAKVSHSHPKSENSNQEEKKHTQKIDVNTKDKVLNDSSTLEASTKKQTNNSWRDILNAIKGHHNTLYGILKMSEVTMEKSTIELTFKFAFHEKQFLQTRHINTLKNTLKEKTGTEYEVKTKVNSKQHIKNTTTKVQTNKNSVQDDLQNVSNIFSGAELLE